MNSILKQNRKDRLDFVDRWTEYVRTHSDKDWSEQQNIIINSCLQTASMTKEQYLDIKKERKKIRRAV